MTAPLDNQHAHWREVLWPIQVDFPGVEGLIVPSGSTAQRPTSPPDGYIRYNTNFTALEARIGGVWTLISTVASATTFLGLSDTPGSYTGLGSRTLRINFAETALEFTDALRIEPTGLLNVAATPSYESLVVTDDSVPNKKYVDDQDDLRVAVAGDIMDSAANLIFQGGGEVLGLPIVPTLSTSAASKAYVDGISAGLDPKESVRAATTSILDNVGNGVWTRAGAGVGATLTAQFNGTTTLDSLLLADGDRVLVKDEDGTGGNLTAVNNGIYTASFTDVGSLTRLTRATDQDGTPSNEVSGGNHTFVEQGTANIGSGWVVVFDGNLIVDTDSMNWTQFSALGTTSLIVDADLDTKVDVEETSDEDIIRFDTGESPTGYGAVTDIMTLASSGWTVAMGTANVSMTDGAPISITAGTGAAVETSAGGTVTITGGAGGASVGDGGTVSLIGGSAVGGGTGGAANVTAGAGASDGGAVNITSGAAGGTGIGGDVLVNAGDGATTGRGGLFSVTAGDGAGAAAGGGITMTAGSGIGATATGGGDVEITAGAAGDNAVIAGDIGGSVSIAAGAGGNGGAGTSSAGGSVTIGGGDGGTSPSTAIGGSVIITGGDGRTAGSANLTGGNATVASGGPVNLTAGAGITGGNISLTPGFGTAGNGGTTTIRGGSGTVVGGDIILELRSGATGNDVGEIRLRTQAGTTATAPLIFQESPGNGTDFVGLQAPASVTLSYTLTWPAADAAGALTSDGGGNLSFVTPSTTNIIDADGDTKVDVEESADEDIIRFDTGDTGSPGYGVIGNIMTLASSGWTVAMGLATGLNTVGAPIVIGAGSGTGTNAGGAATITAGTAGATGVGGVASLIGGLGGSTSGNGGDANLTGGSAVGGGVGGAANVTAGTGASDGGAVNIASGNAGGTGVGGAVAITSGNSVGPLNAGGAISMTAGNGGTSGTGGAVTITAGVGGNLKGIGGAVNVTGGQAGDSADGGAVNITGGLSGTTENDGGAVNITGGFGEEFGGAIIIRGGGSNLNAGAVTITSVAAERGGRINITGGTGTVLDGGNVVITGGAATDSGVTDDGGDITIQGGTTVGGSGGSVTINAQNSAGANIGGAVTIVAGQGGPTGAAGGALSMTAGAGGRDGGTGGVASLNAGSGVTIAVEITSVTTVADVAGSLNSTFFRIDSPTTPYYVWYDVSGGGVDPAGANPGRTGITVAITTGDADTVVATATRAAVGANPDFGTAGAGAIVTITNAAAGPVPDAVDGSAPTGFGFVVLGQGAGGLGGALSLTAGNTTIAGAGGAVSMTAGNASTTGAGGAVTITSGVGAGLTGNGGDITLATGAGQNIPGEINLTAANNAGSKSGGAVTIIAGDGGGGGAAGQQGVGGAVTITAGGGFSADGGSVFITAGSDLNDVGGTTGGNIELTAGRANSYGAVIIKGRTAVGGAGELRIEERAGSGDHFFSLQARNMVANVEINLPIELPQATATVGPLGGQALYVRESSGEGNATFDGPALSIDTETTVDATVTTTVSIPIASGQSVFYKVWAVGRQDTTGDSIAVELTGGIKNQAGTTALFGSQVKDVFDEAGSSTWDVTAIANDTSDTLQIQVTGEAAHTIDWNINVQTVEV